jgi:hypothetical protein
MREHLVAQNGTGDMGSMDEVELQKPSLQMALLWLVVFESVQ